MLCAIVVKHLTTLMPRVSPGSLSLFLHIFARSLSPFAPFQPAALLNTLLPCHHILFVFRLQMLIAIRHLAITLTALVIAVPRVSGQFPPGISALDGYETPCPTIDSLFVRGRSRKVLRTVRVRELERCYYLLQWDKGSRLAWSEFSDQPGPLFEEERLAWKKLGLLESVFTVQRGLPYEGNSFLVIRGATNLLNPVTHLGDERWDLDTVHLCHKRVKELPVLVGRLFKKTTERGVLSTFNPAYIWVNDTWTEAYFLGFDDPKLLRRRPRNKEIAREARRVRRAAQQYYTQSSLCAISV